MGAFFGVTLGGAPQFGKLFGQGEHLESSPGKALLLPSKEKSLAFKTPSLGTEQPQRIWGSPNITPPKGPTSHGGKTFAQGETYSSWHKRKTPPPVIKGAPLEATLYCRGLPRRCTHTTGGDSPPVVLTLGATTRAVDSTWLSRANHLL